MIGSLWPSVTGHLDIVVGGLLVSSYFLRFWLVVLPPQDPQPHTPQPTAHNLLGLGRSATVIYIYYILFQNTTIETGSRIRCKLWGF